MRLSLNWLKEYVDIDVGPQELANRLTMAGLEVESLERRYSPLDKVVIGHIKAVSPHPNADRLTVLRSRQRRRKPIPWCAERPTSRWA